MIMYNSQKASKYTMDYTVISNQNGPHKELAAVVAKHITHPYRRPIPPLQQQIFQQLDQHIRKDANKLVILDFGCGTGHSSQILAEQFPDHWVIGIDKSISRLSKNSVWKQHSVSPHLACKDNLMLAQADLFALVPQIAKADWPVARQYHFYPNPWPKAEQLKRRLHGHPLFSQLLSLSDYVEVRSNWPVYLAEFLAAARQVDPRWRGNVKNIMPGDRPMTLFEKKYWQAEQSVGQLILRFGAVDRR